MKDLAIRLEELREHEEKLGAFLLRQELRLQELEHSISKINIKLDILVEAPEDD